MKDLDFDELDKAVNSLMTGVSKTPEKPRAEDKETTLDITPTLNADTPVSFDTLDEATKEATNVATPVEDQKKEVVAATIAETSSPVPTPPAARRGGRFMDVVHPSSDMKKSDTPARLTSRQGLTLEPTVSSRPSSIRSFAPSTPSNKTNATTETKPESFVPEELLDSGSSASAVNEWPDPLAMTDFAEDKVPEEKEWNAPSAVSSATSHSFEPSPLVSPFLPDTKVEKRPLGIGVSEPSDELNNVDTEPREDKTIDDPADQLPASPSDVPPQLPEELQDDLMAVESDTHMGVPKTELTHPSDEKLLESGLPEEPATTAQPVVSTGPISIPQQYREEPSTGDKANAGIYDTDSYHQPLTHPAKKKSGWMWIVWIIVILLIGAGAGAALYFSGLV
jgi:hypothetical protein